MRRYTRLRCLLAALWLALAMCGASPQLHHKLHEDAANPEHSCVIEHVSQGAFLFMLEPIIPTAPAEIIISSFEPALPFLPSRDFRVAFSRGPPASSTSRTVAG
jgi:hypothetical protein